MSSVPQKELVTGVERYPLDAEVPNVVEKLFSLRNQCTECNVCEVACSLVHSPDGTVNPQYARLKINHAPAKPSKVVLVVSGLLQISVITVVTLHLALKYVLPMHFIMILRQRLP